MIIDILTSRCIPLDPNILMAECAIDHRVRARRFLQAYIPRDSVGVELGVFTGLFSSFLAANPRIAEITFVDPWWTIYGDRFPDWGRYTNFGRIETQKAYSLAKRRIESSGRPHRSIAVSTSCNWLLQQPEASLDWAYLDSTHCYEGTKEELSLLDRIVKQSGVIMGDDWTFSGVSRAVTEFAATSDFKIVFANVAHQWMLVRGRSPGTID